MCCLDCQNYGNFSSAVSCALRSYCFFDWNELLSEILGQEVVIKNSIIFSITHPLLLLY